MININKSTENSKLEGVGGNPNKKPELPPLDERKAEKFRDFVKQNPEELKLKQKKTLKEGSSLTAFASIAEEVSEKAEKGVAKTVVPQAHEEAKEPTILQKTSEEGADRVNGEKNEPSHSTFDSLNLETEKEEDSYIDPQEVSENLENAFIALGNTGTFLEKNSNFSSKKEDSSSLKLKHHAPEESAFIEDPVVPEAPVVVLPTGNAFHGSQTHFASVQAGSKVNQPAAIVELAEKMVQSIVEKTDKVGDSKLIVFLRSPPIFDGAVIEISAVQSAPNEFNIKFSNLLPQAQELLSNKENIDLLHSKLQDKGIVLHQIQTTEQGIYTPLQSGDGHGYQEDSGRGGSEGREEQNEPEDPFNLDSLKKKPKKGS